MEDELVKVDEKEMQQFFDVAVSVARKAGEVILEEWYFIFWNENYSYSFIFSVLFGAQRIYVTHAMLHVQVDYCWMLLLKCEPMNEKTLSCVKNKVNFVFQGFLNTIECAMKMT